MVISPLNSASDEGVIQRYWKNPFLLLFRAIWILSWILFMALTLKFGLPVCYSLYWVDCFGGDWVLNYCYLLRFIFNDSFPLGVRGARIKIGVDAYFCLNWCEIWFMEWTHFCKMKIRWKRSLVYICLVWSCWNGPFMIVSILSRCV